MARLSCIVASRDESATPDSSQYRAPSIVDPGGRGSDEGSGLSVPQEGIPEAHAAEQGLGCASLAEVSGIRDV